MMAVRRADVEDHAPAFAFKVTRPVVVGDDDLMIARVTSCGNERAAVTGTDQSRSIRNFLLGFEPRHLMMFAE